MNEVRGPAVLFLNPGAKVVDPAGVARLGFTVVQPVVTADLGPCALEGCDGLIRQVSIPVQRPGSKQQSLHHVNVCTQGCGTRTARSSGEGRTQFIADQVGWLKRGGMLDEDIRRIHPGAL
ncbi:MAG: hypothetical protein PHI73_04045 [Patescibacteria group bacterium]|nr:hypothetical protein [Patescibacteria group bacterium]